MRSGRVVDPAALLIRAVLLRYARVREPAITAPAPATAIAPIAAASQTMPEMPSLPSPEPVAGNDCAPPASGVLVAAGVRPAAGANSASFTDAAGGTSYYLHYSPDNEENQRVSLRTLPDLVKKDPHKNLVIYAERVWLHGDELAKFEREHARKIRTMVIPFGLK